MGKVNAMRQDLIEDAWDAGRKAFYDHEDFGKFAENPYCLTTQHEQWQAWKDGWHETAWDY